MISDAQKFTLLFQFHLLLKVYNAERNHPNIVHFLKDTRNKLSLDEILHRQLHNLPNGRIACGHFKVQREIASRFQICNLV